MYFLITKANYEEMLIHPDLIVTIVPNGKTMTIFTPKQTHEAFSVKALDDKAVRAKCLQWIKEIDEEENNGILSSN